MKYRHVILSLFFSFGSLTDKIHSNIWASQSLVHRSFPILVTCPAESNMTRWRHSHTAYLPSATFTIESTRFSYRHTMTRDMCLWATLNLFAYAAPLVMFKVFRSICWKLKSTENFRYKTITGHRTLIHRINPVGLVVNLLFSSSKVIEEILY